MPFCPNCGSYVSPGTNICSCGTTFGYNSEPEKEKEPTEFEKQQKEKRKLCNGYYQEAKKLMDDGKYLESIEYIDKALETSKSSFYIMAKAKAYYYAGMYEEALPLFKQSIAPYQGIDNYIIFEWIGDTLNELNRFEEAIKSYKEAINIINKDYAWTINFHKEQRWDSPSDAYLNSLLTKKNERISNLKDRIDYSIKLKNEIINKKSTISDESDYEEKEELLIDIGKKNLITITGTRFHGNHKFKKGMELLLKKEKDNEFDSDAIAVYLNNVKVGYVANNEHTTCYLTSMASEIQISDIAHAKYLLYFAYSYHIAEIIETE